MLIGIDIYCIYSKKTERFVKNFLVALLKDAPVSTDQERRLLLEKRLATGSRSFMFLVPTAGV